MSAALALKPEPTAPTRLPRPALEKAIAGACGKVAPLWPLKTFVAVNPFLGFADRSFEAASTHLRRVCKTDMLPERRLYRDALDDGRIADTDLLAALAASPWRDRLPRTPDALRAAAAREPLRIVGKSGVVATVSEVLDSLSAGDRHASRTAFMIDEISRWCAAWFDEGQAPWGPLDRDLAPYAAWRLYALEDRNPETMGVKGFRKVIAEAPTDPVEAIAWVVEGLGLPERALEDYLYRALFDIQGWAAFVRQKVWTSNLHGHDDDRLVQLLAIRVVWGYALFRERTDAAFVAAWRKAMQDAAELPDDAEAAADPETALDLLLQDAWERAFQRVLLSDLTAPKPVAAPTVRAAVQAAFCIDVRSEVFRRALESVRPDYETIGFAGFFGFPIEYVPIGREVGGAQCPVLLKPAFVVCEGVVGASDAEERSVLDLRLLRRRAAKTWKAFKQSAVSSFTFVEAAGLAFAAKLVGDAAGLTRPAPDPTKDGVDPEVLPRVGPRLEPLVVGGRRTGFDDAQRVAMAEAVLKAMSMTENFARLALLVGHGSTTVNNPHASGLDCGACGGHTGEANARVAAGILNDPAVREGLREKGILVPVDTWFVGALHDTTTDEVRLYDLDGLPASHAADLVSLKAALAEAGAIARRDRAPSLGLARDLYLDGAIRHRSRDWAQVRPEWGLANNAAFIAAPRARTKGLDLNGRAFLHSYVWEKDEGFKVLELILTAPVVVASWINLQYYASTVNNRVFGSGDKTLHNVVGQIGVLEGNGGDLRVGLPWQSVHDGRKFMHEPLRLSVMIEAPESAIDAILNAHAGVRDLVDNGWIHLFAIADEGRTVRKRLRGGGWAAA